MAWVGGKEHRGHTLLQTQGRGDCNGGATIEARGGSCTPPFSNYSIFAVLIPPPSKALTPANLQIRGAALGGVKSANDRLPTQNEHVEKKTMG